MAETLTERRQERTTCRHRLSWNEEWRCRRRPVFGLCIQHWLERVRYEQHVGPFFVSLDLSNVNRPYVQVDEERPIKWAALSWGNENSDAVWSVNWSRAESR